METTADIAEDVSPAGRSGNRLLRRPILVSALAIGLVGGFGGVAVAATSDSSVAGSVKGALVTIVSTDGYEGATAAGTGMVLTSDGEILTNNHVIEGSTSIQVTVVATGRTYSATVVGTDPTDDVAVIQLKNARGLKTLPIGRASSVDVGDTVVASGNAGGTGEISTVSGSVTELDQAITASDGDGTDSEQLTGLIQTDAPIVAGDSGGALATTSGKVIGMNTAASVANSMSGQAFGGSSSAAVASEAYAIPIQSALTIATKIVNGEESSTIHIGVQGFLGVELQAAGAGTGFGGSFGSAYGSDYGSAYGSTSDVTGVTVAGVIDGGAAAAAGLTAGDAITSIDGKTVGSATALSTLMDGTSSGQKVTVGWTDTSGATRTATATLTAGPAD